MKSSTLTLHLSHSQICFPLTVTSLPSTCPTLSSAFLLAVVSVLFCVLVTPRTVGLVGIEMSASFYYVLHVVRLCSAFEMVWVDASWVVALVSYDRRKEAMGKEERYTVGGSMFPVYVDLPVAV